MNVETLPMNISSCDPIVQEDNTLMDIPERQPQPIRDSILKINNINHAGKLSSIVDSLHYDDPVIKNHSDHEHLMDIYHNHDDDPFLFVGMGIIDPLETQLIKSQPGLSNAETPIKSRVRQSRELLADDVDPSSHSPTPEPVKHLFKDSPTSRNSAKNSVEIEDDDFSVGTRDDGDLPTWDSGTKRTRSFTVILDQTELCKLFHKSFRKTNIHSRWKAAMKIQRWYRNVVSSTRKRLLVNKCAATRIQAWWRSIIKQKERASIIIQKSWRRCVSRKYYSNCRFIALRLQWTYRWNKIREFNRKTLEHSAATLIQSYLRSSRERKRFLLMKAAIIRIQRRVKRFICDQRLAASKDLEEKIISFRHHSSASKIQRSWRSYTHRRAEYIQREIQQRHLSAFKIQLWWRQRQMYQKKVASALKIQLWWRSYLVRRQSDMEKNDTLEQATPASTLSLKSSLGRNRKQLEAIKAKKNGLPILSQKLSSVIRETGFYIHSKSTNDKKDSSSFTPPQKQSLALVAAPNSSGIISELSPKSLNNVTARNTKQNGVYTCKIVKQVVHKFCDPPPSPSQRLEQRFLDRQQQKAAMGYIQRDYSETARRAFQEEEENGQEENLTISVDKSSLAETQENSYPLKKRKRVHWDKEHIVTVFEDDESKRAPIHDTNQTKKRLRTESDSVSHKPIPIPPVGVLKRDAPILPVVLDSNTTIISPVKLAPSTIVVYKYVYPSPEQVLSSSSHQNSTPLMSSSHSTISSSEPSSKVTTAPSDSAFSFDHMDVLPQRKPAGHAVTATFGGVLKKRGGIAKGPRRVLKPNTMNTVPSLPEPGTTSTLLSKPAGRFSLRSPASLGPPKRHNPISPTHPSSSFLWRAQIADLKKRIDKK